MDGGAWEAAVHGVAKSQTQMSDFTFTFFMYMKIIKYILGFLCFIFVVSLFFYFFFFTFLLEYSCFTKVC